MWSFIFSNSLYRKHREQIIQAIDLCVVLISFIIAYLSDFDFNLSMLSSLFANGVSLIVIVFVFGVTTFFFKVRKSLWRYAGINEVLRIGVATFIAMIIILVFERTGLTSLGEGVAVVGSTFSALIMCLTRLAYRLFRNYSKSGLKSARKIFIIGAGDAGYILLKEIQQNKSFDVNVVGLIDDKKVGSIISGYTVLGTTEDIPQLAQDHEVSFAYIAIPSASKRDIRRIVEICQHAKVEVKIMRKSTSLMQNASFSIKYPIEDISIEDLLGREEIRLEQHEISSYITGLKVLVTGAGGSIGSELCRQIVKFKPAMLVMVDINENSLYMLEQEFNRDRIHGRLDPNIAIYSLIASIRDYAAIDDIFTSVKPDVVFHAAAHKHVPLMEMRPQEAIKNNIFGTDNLIHIVLDHQVSRFIIISTDKAVNPTNVMGASKRMTEMLLQAYGKNSTTKMAAVRFGNVLGSAGSVIPIFREQIKQGGPVTVTDKNIVRYFMTIPEAAQLVLQAGYYADDGDIFVLDMGEPVRIMDLAEKMIRLSGYEPGVDIKIKEIGLRPGEKMFEELRLDSEKVAKTKNNLIFRNHMMNISVEDMEKKMADLKRLIEMDDPNTDYKKILLSMIISDQNQKV